MHKFLELNRAKLKFAFTRTSLIFLTVVSIFLGIGYLTGNLPDAVLLFTILFTAGIIFPLFIILITYFTWLHKSSVRRKLFSKTPFDQTKNIGFYKSYLNLNTKWFFTEEVKEGKLNDFLLVVDVCRDKNHVIEVTAATEWKKLDKSEYTRLHEKFRQYGIELRIGCLVKRYNTKRLTVHTVSDLESDLLQFTSLLKQEGFEPQKQQGGAEY